MLDMFLFYGLMLPWAAKVSPVREVAPPRKGARSKPTPRGTGRKPAKPGARAAGKRRSGRPVLRVIEGGRAGIR